MPSKAQHLSERVHCTEPVVWGCDETYVIIGGMSASLMVPNSLLMPGMWPIPTIPTTRVSSGAANKIYILKPSELPTSVFIV